LLCEYQLCFLILHPVVGWIFVKIVPSFFCPLHSLFLGLVRRFIVLKFITFHFKRNTIIMNVTLIVIMWCELNFVSIFPWYVLKGLNFLLMFSFVFLFKYMLFCRSFDYNGFHLVVWGGREEIPFCFWFIWKN
jgi:hypothetical protein